MPQFTDCLMWTGIACGILLAGTLVLLLLTKRRIRKRTLNLRNRNSEKVFGLFNVSAEEKESVPYTIQHKPLRTVIGNAMVWKELQDPILKRRKLRQGFYCFLGMIVYGLVLVLMGILLSTGSLESAILIEIFLGAVAIFLTAMFSAEAVTSEKESGSWPTLLTTLLTARQILFGKFIGVIKRSFIFWFLFIAFWLILMYVRLVHSFCIWHACILVEVFLFTYATGVCSSILFHRTTTAVLSTLGLLGVTWIGSPVYWLIRRHFWFHFSTMDNVMEMALIFSPLIQWITLEDEYIGPSFWNFAVKYVWIGNVLISVALLLLANHFLRKRVF